MSVSVDSAAWQFESPTFGLHTSRGDYYLYVNATLRNLGSVGEFVSSSSFRILWENSTQGVVGTAAWSSFTLIAGANSTLLVAFNATGLPTPSRVEFEWGGSSSAFAPVPTPAPPPQEIVIRSVVANRSLVDSYGLPAPTGNEYLWVSFILENHWNEDVSINIFNFEIQDANGSKYTASGRKGPDKIAAGGTANASINFQVPLNWIPATLQFDQAFGPWADAAVPPPA